MMQCEIIRDLLPLYIDGLTGAETNREIETHLTGCEACAKELERLRTPIEQPEPRAEVWKAAVKQEKKSRRRRLALICTLALLLGIAICLGVLYSQDFFSIQGREKSPDGKFTVIVREGAGDHFIVWPKELPSIRLSVMKGVKQVSLDILGGVEFQSMHWSPNSEMVAVQQRYYGIETVTVKRMPFVYAGEAYGGGEYVSVQDVLEMVVRKTPALDWVQWDETGAQPLLDCRFICWSEDSKTILLSARGTDAQGETRQGYLLFYPLRLADPISNPNTPSIEVVSDFSSSTQPAPGEVWQQQARAFEAWAVKQGLAPTQLHTSSLSDGAESLQEGKSGKASALTFAQLQKALDCLAAYTADPGLAFAGPYETGTFRPDARWYTVGDQAPQAFQSFFVYSVSKNTLTPLNGTYSGSRNLGVLSVNNIDGYGNITDGTKQGKWCYVFLDK